MSPKASERKYLISWPGLIPLAFPVLSLLSVLPAEFILLPHLLDSPFLLHTPQTKPCPGNTSLAFAHTAKSSRHPSGTVSVLTQFPLFFAYFQTVASPFLPSLSVTTLAHSTIHTPLVGPARQESRTWERKPAVWTFQVLSTSTSRQGFLLPYLHSLLQENPQAFSS